MKKLLLSLLLLVLVITVAACSSKASGERPGTATPAQDGVEVSEANPLVKNEEKKTLSVYATVNGKYLFEPTRHGLNFREGKFGDQAIFVAYANPLDFHDALVELGAEPGDNLGKGSDETIIKGESVDITITWEGAGKEYTIDEVILDSEGKAIDQKFGGNFENAKGAFTGCLMCLDSCTVGITSNSSHELKSFDDKKVEFKGNSDILPEDGTPVVVTFTIVD